jgi:hypothetical protein
MAVRNNDLNPPKVLRTHRPKHADVESSGAPYADVQPEREIVTENLPRRSPWFREHALHIGLGMLLMLLLWYAGVTYVLPFVTQTIDRWNCGENRICHYDLNVGHNGTSHFITEYWHSQVIVIEIQQGHPENTKLYAQTIFAAGDTSPRLVTLTPAYLSRHPVQGKPDVVASVEGFALPVIFYNTGSSFSTEDPHA